MTTVWRYMDLWKFESILEKKSLYFGTAASQSDKLEGIPTTGEKLMRSRHYASLPRVHQSSLLNNDETQDEYERLLRWIINCWHINDKLNPKAWDEYITDEQAKGLAIKTTLDVLNKNFDVYTSKEVLKDKVKYIDRSTYKPKTLHSEGKIFEKRDSLSWENEYRFVIDTMFAPVENQRGSLTEVSERHKQSNGSFGYFILVDVKALITDVYIHPNAPSNFQNEVEILCRKHGLSPNIY
ncbi:MAG: hypothetical protein WBC91_08290 [Phototrophicaceae bacterium]